MNTDQSGRVIKFRCWDVQGEKMFIPKEIPNDLIGTIPEDPDEQFFVHMQFTGLKDKAGKEIYEHDLIISAGKVLSPYIVEWKDFHGWCLRHPDNKDAIWLADHVWKDAEVIGNIYENSNLLNHV
jgi:uncharacterized phage protein (TIGR01671 family)